MKNAIFSDVGNQMSGELLSGKIKTLRLSESLRSVPAPYCVLNSGVSIIGECKRNKAPAVFTHSTQRRLCPKSWDVRLVQTAVRQRRVAIKDCYASNRLEL